MTPQRLAEIEGIVADNGAGWCQECGLDGLLPELVAEVARLRAAMRAMWEQIGRVANECEGWRPDDPPECQLVPGNEVLTEWGQRCTRACELARETLEGATK